MLHVDGERVPAGMGHGFGREHVGDGEPAIHGCLAGRPQRPDPVLAHGVSPSVRLPRLCRLVPAWWLIELEPHRSLELLAVHHEPAIAAYCQDAAVRMEELR